VAIVTAIKQVHTMCCSTAMVLVNVANSLSNNELATTWLWTLTYQSKVQTPLK